MNQQQADKKKARVAKGGANLIRMVTRYTYSALILGTSFTIYGLYKHIAKDWALGVAFIIIGTIMFAIKMPLIKFITSNTDREIRKIKVDEGEK